MSEITLTNLTPHNVRIFHPCPGYVFTDIPPARRSLRLRTKEKTHGLLRMERGYVPTVSISYELIQRDLSLPSRRNHLYLVSLLAAQRMWEQGRLDVVAPDTSPASVVRDDQGQIIGVRRLVCGPEGVLIWEADL